MSKTKLSDTITGGIEKIKEQQHMVQGMHLVTEDKINQAILSSLHVATGTLSNMIGALYEAYDHTRVGLINHACDDGNYNRCLRKVISLGMGIATEGREYTAIEEDAVKFNQRIFDMEQRLKKLEEELLTKPAAPVSVVAVTDDSDPGPGYIIGPNTSEGKELMNTIVKELSKSDSRVSKVTRIERNALQRIISQSPYRTLVCAHRRSGKTMAMVIDAISNCLLISNFDVLCITGGHGNREYTLEILDMILRNYELEGEVDSRSGGFIRFKNNSTITVLGDYGGCISGEIMYSSKNANRVIVDNATVVRPQSWERILKIKPRNGIHDKTSFMIIYTPDNLQDPDVMKFARLVATLDDFALVHYPITVNPEMSPERIEKVRAACTERLWRNEWLAQWWSPRQD